MSDVAPTKTLADRVLAGGGASGALARSIDWAKTAVGPVATWSQALRSTVALLLHNDSAMLLWWGPQLVQLYNDAYRPILADKHPKAMGQPVSECWSEIWHIIGPMIEAPFHGGPASASDDLFLALRRKSFLEEAHFRVAYSPVPDESVPGTGIGGVLATVTETTQQMYGERQLRTLRELGHRSDGEAKTIEEACAAAAATLASNRWDVPFSLFYLLDCSGKRATLAASSGFADVPVPDAAPCTVTLDDRNECRWPLGQVAATRAITVITELDACADVLPASPWHERPHAAIMLPLAAPEQANVYGVLVCGISPHRELDPDYRTFFELVAGQVVTSLRNARALQEARERADALAAIDHAKTTFFSNISHEFRTPLTLMLGPTEDALASPGCALAGPELETVYRNELRLLKLVNTLLDFARTEAGRMRATYVATDLAEHTAELASMFRSAIERAGLHYRIECAPLGERIYVDPQMWEKIVLNLLSNALKFTFHGEIAVRIEDRGDTVQLSVTDTGVGIPAHELPHLFERFHRVEGGEARTHEGSGIGLALVHDLVGEHGGTIEATSTPGFGSRFVVTLRKGTSHLDRERIVSHAPVRARAITGKAFVEEAMRWLPEADAEPHVASAPPGAARVLVADDNADMREYVTRLLRARWIVHAVADGRAALEAALADPPDLVLADVMMPKLDGFELVADLRRDPRTRAIPVVLLSARAGEEARIEGLQAGADDYLLKPFSARELITRVETHLELSKARHDGAKERERLLHREQAARLEAEAASRAKDEFLGVVSHELRTPLNAVMGWSRLLLDGGLSPTRQRHGLEVIERNARTQAQLIDDLLDVSRIISGKVRIDPRPIRPTEFVFAAVESVRLAANAKSIDLDVDVDAGSDHILGDCDRLQQVVWNLLANAIKFTPSAGRVTVRVTRNAGSVEISVCDNGRGIRADFLPHVFERFRQADSAMTRSAGGLGLGLAIARHLTELHGGTIDARSQGEGLGSTFTVRLPVMARHAPAVAHEARERVSAPPRTPHDHLDLASFDVLVVDDEQDARDVLTEILERANARVIGAASASEAYELLARERPAVLVSDIGMPGEDGFTLIRRVRALPAEDGGRTPAIAFTAYARSVDRQQALLAGYDVHLGKPIDPGELIDVVAKLAANAHD